MVYWRGFGLFLFLLLCSAVVFCFILLSFVRFNGVFLEKEKNIPFSNCADPPPVLGSSMCFGRESKNQPTTPTNQPNGDTRSCL